jgi:hypothetical protein
LEPYNYTVIHRAGRKHNNADAMSRMYETEEPIYMLGIEEQEIDWTNPEGYNFEFIEDNQACKTKEEWFTAGQYCTVCKSRSEDHHTHAYCIQCQHWSDRNKYPFIDNCTCKGKKRDQDLLSERTQSTQLILNEPYPRPLSNRKFKYQPYHYNFDHIPRRKLTSEEFEEPIQLSDNYWWLPKLQQPSKRYLDEFNNNSDSYLYNSTWWMDTNPVTYY